MYFNRYKRAAAVPYSSDDLDTDAVSEGTDQSLRPPNSDSDVVFTPKARGYVKGLVNTLSLAKLYSLSDVSDKSGGYRKYRTGMNELLKKASEKRAALRLEESDGEVEPKAKHNSLISIMVSTIMCLAAGCPMPKSNIQATKLFLSTIVTEHGETPKNVRGLMALLKRYDGPYEGPSTSSKQPEPDQSDALDQDAEETSHDPSDKPTGQPSVERVKKAAPRMRSRLPSLSPVKRVPDSKKEYS